MNSNFDQSQAQALTPPRLIPSILTGFNIVANHIYIILLPILLDLFLWFGPHLRLKTLLSSVIIDLLNTARNTGNTQTQEMLVGVEESWKAFLEHFNLLSSLSTFPLGIPSLLAAEPPLNTPLGNARLIEITSPVTMVLFWGIFLGVGFALGCIYLATISNASQPLTPRPAVFSLRGLKVTVWQIVQMFVLLLFLVMFLVILSVPTLVISSFLAYLSPGLGAAALLIVGFLIVWIMIPLIFSPHGIFIFQQNAFRSALNSIVIVRSSLSLTGLFLLTSIILYQGMDILWRTPADNSWMLMVGILGHAFISSGLLAASFAYYLSASNWVQAMRMLANQAVQGRS